MKKTLFLVLTFITIFAVTSSAQVKVSGGFMGGLNLAKANIDPDQTGVELNNLTAFGIGGVLNFAFDGGFNIKLEPMYLQAGSKITSGSQEAKFKVNYISVPVMFVYVFPSDAGQIQPYLMAGPSLGIKMSAKYFDPNDVETDIKDDIKSTDFGATFGAGINIPAGTSIVFIEGRYSLGLSDINNDPTFTGTIKTKGIQAFVGIMFPFGK